MTLRSLKKSFQAILDDMANEPDFTSFQRFQARWPALGEAEFAQLGQIRIGAAVVVITWKVNLEIAQGRHPYVKPTEAGLFLRYAVTRHLMERGMKKRAAREQARGYGHYLETFAGDGEIQSLLARTGVPTDADMLPFTARLFAKHYFGGNPAVLGMLEACCATVLSYYVRETA